MMHSKEQFGYIFITVHFEIRHPGCFLDMNCNLAFSFLKKLLLGKYIIV